jgi:hypothetical protein
VAIARSAPPWLVLLAASGAACSSHNVHGNALELRRDTTATTRSTAILRAGPLTLGDFEYRATNSGLKSRWPPASVQVTVTIRNVSTHAATLDALTGNCAVRLRLYRADEVTQAKAKDAAVNPVFDAAQPGFECYVPELHRRLAAGDTLVLQSAGDGPGIRLPSGRYDVTGVVTVVPSPDTLRRTGPHLVEVPAGSIRVPLPYD